MRAAKGVPRMNNPAINLLAAALLLAGNAAFASVEPGAAVGKNPPATVAKELQQAKT